eukprot:TRINITY_DN1133_c0_g1_i5.p1 TRINITY_DN1133_c0_g1~~TRINITY_DN1133_c0_g1_i5.p1  ORF type:complete len:599 (+),score=81.24 TRINITY_DN1133_c0_g1_i5:118-1914(+)
MIRRPPRSTQGVSSAASDVYKRQVSTQSTWGSNRILQQNYVQKIENLCQKFFYNEQSENKENYHNQVFVQQIEVQGEFYMANDIKKIALLTGGGDCPGLNAVIRAVTRSAILNYGYEVIGYKFGYRGLYNNDFIKLNLSTVSGLLPRGGTILYSSNKDNLFDYSIEENGKFIKKDVSDVAVENMKKEGVDVLIVIGGDGTLTSARDFSRKGVKVIGVPKTIDNDLGSTDITFGFNTSISVATEALDRLHTTAESHHRIMILEVMGRNAGFIALESGIAGSADVILLPEIPYDINKIVDKVEERKKQGKLFTIIVVAEGAKSKDGNVVVAKIVEDSPDPIRLGGIGNKLAEDLEKLVKEREVRCTVLGHIQRGGITCTYDRILSTRYGVAAVELIKNQKFGSMVCLKGNEITYDSLENVIGNNKKVDTNGELVTVAKKIGICFADQFIIIDIQRDFILDQNMFVAINIIQKVVGVMKEIKKYLETRIGTYGFFFEDLESGYSFGYNENVQMISAGCMKLPISMSVIKYVEKEKASFLDKIKIHEEDKVYGTGILHEFTDREYTIFELLVAMLIQSDNTCLLYTSPSPRDLSTSRMPSSA